MTHTTVIWCCRRDDSVCVFVVIKLCALTLTSLSIYLYTKLEGARDGPGWAVTGCEWRTNTGTNKQLSNRDLAQGQKTTVSGSQLPDVPHRGNVIAHFLSSACQKMFDYVLCLLRSGLAGVFAAPLSPSLPPYILHFSPH